MEERNGEEKGAQLTSTEQKILIVLEKKQSATATEWERACDAAGIPRPTFYKIKSKLCDAGYVKQDGSGRGTTYDIADTGGSRMMSPDIHSDLHEAEGTTDEGIVSSMSLMGGDDTIPSFERLTGNAAQGESEVF